MDPLTKTYVSFGLVVLALFEFWSVMRIFGKRPPGKGARLTLRLHRIGGYVFLVYFAWISWICFNMMGRLSEGSNRKPPKCSVNAPSAASFRETTATATGF